MSVLTVRVDAASAPYDVVIGPGLLDEVGSRLREITDARKIALVSDGNVAGLLGARAVSQIASKGFEVHPLTVEAGEKSKNWQVAGELLEALAAAGLDRTDMVVALGGGVIGDLAGFAAAAYLRGIEFAQLPTTLLAQVDSSVGGKTGVDLRAGKNLAGAFKQPRLVLADTDALKMLPEIEWRSGLAEVAKSAIISGDEFMAWAEGNSGLLAERDEGVTADTVERCVAFKSQVVRTDEREEGVRECLNYGHTLGHAIENIAGYGVVSHGLAVAEGIRFAARLAAEASGASMRFVKRQDALLDGLGLPQFSEGFEPDEILAAMHADKKARDGKVRFVLADAPGAWKCQAVDDAMIMEHLEAWTASKRRD